MSRELQSGVGPKILIDGRSYINFAGSSYLGLSRLPAVVDAGIAALRAHGAGMTLSRGLGPAASAMIAVEQTAAAFFDSEDAVFLSSGYHFGLAALAAFSGGGFVAYRDEHAHYALRDAIGASGLRAQIYRHCDPANLREIIAQTLRPGERPLVVTDGLFPVMGRIAPLDRLIGEVVPLGGLLIVDESHSFGVLGAAGKGVVEHFNLPADRLLRGGSLGKAFGTCGGVALATATLADEIRRTPVCRGAAAGSPALAAMCAASIGHIAGDRRQLARLRDNVRHLKAGLRALGWNIATDDVPVIALAMDPPDRLLALRDYLHERGIFVLHTDYVGAGTDSVIRLGVFADHKLDHLDVLIEAIAHFLRTTEIVLRSPHGSPR